jgi:chromosome segregation ATPase
VQEPAYTCPIVDKAKDALDEALRDIQRYVVREVENVKDRLLEDVRDSNTELRDWGRHWKEQSDYWETRAQELQRDFDSATSRVSELEQQLRELEDKYYEVTHGTD